DFTGSPYHLQKSQGGYRGLQIKIFHRVGTKFDCRNLEIQMIGFEIPIERHPEVTNPHGIPKLRDADHSGSFVGHLIVNATSPVKLRNP
ncbi:9576_t:CDS:2, partial [Ambispora leptoticha]